MTTPHPHILVVDDDQDMRDTVKSIVSRLGYQVTTAGNGSIALEKMSAQPFDLIVSDVYMPGLGGHGFVRAVRGSNPHVPIVMMSGDGDMADVIELLRVGVDDYLEKPFRPTELMQSLRTLLERAGPAVTMPNQAATAAVPDTGPTAAQQVAGSAQIEISFRSMLKSLRSDLSANKFSLPAPHPLADQLMKLQSHPNLSSEHVVQMLERSPNIARRIIALANTSHYQGTRRASNLKEAVVRLGNRTVLNEAQTLVHRGFFRAKHTKIDAMVEQLWTRTAYTASFVRELFRLKRLGQPEDAYLVSLFHNVGEIVILRYVADQIEDDMALSSQDIELLGNVCSERHEVMGSSILRHWKFPVACQTVAGCHHSLKPRNGATPPSNADRRLIHACNIAAHVASDQGHSSPFGDGDTLPLNESLAALGVDSVDIEYVVCRLASQNKQLS